MVAENWWICAVKLGRAHGEAEEPQQHWSRHRAPVISASKTLVTFGQVGSHSEAVPMEPAVIHLHLKKINVEHAYIETPRVEMNIKPPQMRQNSGFICESSET